jgi:hypothetical protein
VITLIIEVETLPGKRLEFLRALEGYINLPGIMKKIGEEISSIKWYYLIKQENKFSIKIEFEKLEEMEELLRSELLNVLQGAIKILCKSPDVKITNLPNMTGDEGIGEAIKNKIQSRFACDN